MSLLDSYAGLVVSCMRGRFSGQGGVVLVPWFVRCFRVGRVSRIMFFLELVLLGRNFRQFYPGILFPQSSAKCSSGRIALLQ